MQYISGTGQSFLKLARQDSRYRELIKAIEQGANYRLNTRELYDEVEMLNTQRLIRKLKPQELTMHRGEKLHQAIMQNQAYRTRCVEIKMKCLRRITQLTRYITTVEGWLKEKYGEQLRAQYRLKGDRQAALEYVFERPWQLIDRWQSLIDFVNLVIDDFDKTGFANHNHIELLKLMHNPKKSYEV